MAIASMKKIAVLGLKKDKHRVLKTLQRIGAVEVDEQSPDAVLHLDEREEKRLEDLGKRIARLDLAISRLAQYDTEKRGMLSLPPEATPDQIAGAMAAERDTMKAVERLEQIERSRGELRAREAREQALLLQLTPWQTLSSPLDEMKKTRSADVFLLTVPAKSAQQFEGEIAQLSAVSYEKVSEDREGLHLMMAIHLDEAAAVDELMRKCGATRVTFDSLRGTVPLVIDQTRDQLKRIDEVRGQLTEECKQIASQLPLMRLLRDLSATERDRLSSALRCIHTQSAFYLTGWAVAEQEGRISEAVKKVAPECEVEFSEPDEGDTPPTLLKNKTAVRPFESIVKMYSLPAPDSFDPTFIMMPFWICYFGMMLSDAGYGIILGILCSFAYVKLKGRGIGQMAFILALGGLATVFWGAMYGSWFSIEGIPALLLVPMDQPIEMLVMCIALGAVHLLTGLGVAAYMNIKRGKPFDAFIDQGCWVLLLAGVGLILVNPTVGMIVALIGAVGILLFTKRGTKNPIKRIVGGLGALYGITGYVSDLLSYARLFGMGLATGVIGMVFNMLAGMMFGSPVGTVCGILVLVVGHTFNLFINALGAYVHSCRLQFIEFFGKFYEMGTRGFKPLTINTRYVDIPGEEG